jgi:cytochrome bd ubiquinol oxidase subunit I
MGLGDFLAHLAAYIAVLEGLYLLTGEQIWLRISGFWTRIFAVSFGMGVVSGIIMPFQFGTNWSRFSDAAGDVISPLLSYEGLMAFFLEASFLGVLLFGRRLVPAWAHFFCRRHGRVRDVVVVVLDPRDQFMDADAAGL